MLRIVEAHRGCPIQLYWQGENIVTKVEFDISEFIKDGEAGIFSLLVISPSSSVAYPCSVSRVGENKIQWTVNRSDVAKEGRGLCQIIYTDGEAIAKSCCFDTYIGKSIGNIGPLPEPWEPFQEAILQAAAESLLSAQAAAASANNAQAAAGIAEEAKEEWENMSAEAETLSPGSEATAYYDAGVLYLGIPKGEKGDPGEGVTSWDELTDKPFDTIGDNLKVVGKTLTVDTAPNVQQDNTKPITSAAVYTEVGNINALLALI